jgi:hypothetical protein
MGEGFMGPDWFIGSGGRARQRTGVVLRAGLALALALTMASALAPALRAEPDSGDPQSAGASNGGIATASTGGEVNIGEIVTGENTGNSIVTGDISGSADISGGDIDYPTDVLVVQELGPPIADASGGDGGQAGTTPGDGTTDITIDNTDKNSNKNTSDSNAVINP